MVLMLPSVKENAETCEVISTAVKFPASVGAVKEPDIAFDVEYGEGTEVK
jgi:hypothetical protein